MNTTPVRPMIVDDEVAARTLVTLLGDFGVTAFVHWDRSPWGARIPLTDDDGEFAPALYVLTENTPVTAEVGGRRWLGQLGNFPDEQQDLLTETTFEWFERSWLGDTVHDVALKVQALVPILKRGVA